MPRVHRLTWALAASVLLHAGLLLLRWQAPEAPPRVLQDRGLEVILVNAQSQRRPDKAQALAQHPLDGGGRAERGRASTPLAASPQARDGNSLTPDQAALQSLLAQQERVLAQIKRQLSQLPAPDPNAERAPAASRAQAERRQWLLDRLAEIEQRVEEENARPQKRFISPATREAVYARYYDRLRRQIEQHGTEHFPQHQGEKLYGELTMLITVDQRGRVLQTELVRGSGQRALDRQALALVKSQRFARFDAPLRQRADQIVVASRFHFTRQATLKTQLEGQ